LRNNERNFWGHTEDIIDVDKIAGFCMGSNFLFGDFWYGGLSESVVKKQKQFDGHFSEAL